MSKFVTIKTEVKDREILEQTLTDLNYQFEKGQNLTVRGFMKERSDVGAEIVVRRETTGFLGDVGFARNGERYDVLCDNMDANKFMPKFKQQYSRNKVVKEATLKGYRIASEEKQADGSVRVVMSRYC